VRGTKHFTLFPPTEGHFLVERFYPRAIYERPFPGGPLVLTPLASTSQCHHDVRKEESEADVDSNSEDDHMENMISWASTDTSAPIPGTMPIRVSVHAGETLYLPSGWWHAVAQEGEDAGGKGVVIAVNWWYDMEMRGDRWVWLSILRKWGHEKRV